MADPLEDDQHPLDQLDEKEAQLLGHLIELAGNSVLVLECLIDLNSTGVPLDQLDLPRLTTEIRLRREASAFHHDLGYRA